MTHYCVFEVSAGGNRVVWAWCLLTTGPGFASISFTASDGITPVDPPETYRLGKHLFSALVDVAAAEEGS